MSVVKCVGQVALRKLGFERFPSGVGKHRTQDVRKSGSKCAHNPGGVGRTSAGSGPRIKYISRKRAVGDWRKKSSPHILSGKECARSQ